MPAIFNAIISNNLEAVKLQLLELKGRRILNEIGYTPLACAASFSTRDILEIIMFSTPESELDSADDEGTTALMNAVFHGKYDNAKLLLEHGANPNLFNKHHLAALHICVLKNRKDMADLLLEHGADINAQSDGITTPLIFAIQEDQREFAEYFIKNGADSNIDLNGKTLLHVLASGMLPNFSSDFIKLMLEHGANPDIPDKRGETPLILATQNWNEDIIKTLVEGGVDINKVTDVGTPVITVCMTEINTKKIIHKLNVLIECGANIDMPGIITPLICSINSNNTELMEKLLEGGVNADTPDADGMTPLMYAVHCGNNDALALLLENSADVDLQDNRKRNALIWAIIDENIDAIKTLFENGATLTKKEIYNLRHSTGINQALVDTLEEVLS